MANKSLTNRVIEWLGGVTPESASQRATRAYEAGFEDGNDDPQSGTIAPGGFGYRSSSAAGGIRDFSKLDHGVILENIWSLYMSNPVADRAMEIKRDHILGRGVTIQADDDDLQEIIDAFMEDNDFDKRLKEFTLQLFLLGEQCFPAFVRESDGRVRIGYIDPGEIERVITHPDNVLEMWAVVIKEQASGAAWTKNRGKRVFRIIRKDESFISEDEQRLSPYEGLLVTAKKATIEPWERTMLGNYGLVEYSGSCFFFKVNSVSNQPRGWSDLLRSIDWADQHDETLFSLADLLQFLGYFSWDVKLLDANEDQVKARANEIRRHPPAKGSVNVHNAQEEWNPNTFNMNESPSINAAQEIFNHIWGGLGYPHHWYTSGDSTNRATAESQGAPTWRSLEHDQDIIRDMILMIVCFVRDQAIIAGAWRGDEDKITANMPEMTKRDLGRISQAMVAIANALAMALQNGWIAELTAVEAWAKTMAEYGIEINPIEEMAQVEKEQAEKEDAIGGQIQQQLARYLNAPQNGNGVEDANPETTGVQPEAE